VITIAIILLVTLLTLSHFYLKCSVMTAFSTFMASIFGSIIAFAYYEMLANLFVSRGYGDWAPAGCFVLAFVLGFAAVRALADLLVGANIDFGNAAKVTVNLILGVVTGLILSGHLLVAMGMLPVGGSWWAYNRFPPDSTIAPNNPNRPLLDSDGMVSNLFALFSRGSLSSRNSFGVLCADFVNRNHLNRCGVASEVWTICSKKAISIPKGNQQKPVRTMEIKDIGTVTIVRAIISAKDIPDGGAKDDKGIIFTLSQVRVIAKPREKADNLRGSGKTFWPIGILDKGKLQQKNLSDKITYGNADFRKDRTVWVDFVFEIPAGQQAVLLEFKQNALASLLDSPPVQSTEEIEAVLNNPEGASQENRAGQPPVAP
jgi:hypothetical protein